MNQKEEIARLQLLDDSYHTKGIPLESDTQYDILKANVKAEFPDDPYFDTVGSAPITNKTTLPYILGSLNKTKLDGSCDKWLSKYCKDGVVVSEKMDGCSVYVEYIDGKVTFASTRGDGYQGQDITKKAKVFCKDIDHNGSLKVRGEVYLTFKDTDHLEYKNPRNAVAGILNRDDDDHVFYLKVKFYKIYDQIFEKTVDMFSEINNIGLPCVNFEEYKTTTPEDLSVFYKDTKQSLEYPIDGLVISTSKYEYENVYYPEFTMAFKVNEDAVLANVTGVEWNITRLGKMAPVVLIEPTDISGSTISRVTGFNAGYISLNGIGEGSEIGIVKSGDVIPYIEVINKPVDCKIPTHCPSCFSALEWTITKVDLVCNNPDCSGIKQYQIEHFLESHDVEEMSSATIGAMGINCIEDLYNIDEFSLMNKDGFGSKRVNTIISQIKKTLHTTPANLLRSFGIPGIGKTVSKMVTDRYSFDELFEVDNFRDFEGIGGVINYNLIDGLKSNYSLYKYLQDQSLRFKKTDTTLKGKIFTLTGKSEYKRNDLIKMVESAGGSVKGISKKSNFVVTNDTDSKSGKMKKAHQYGISIISYDDFYEMINI